MGKTAESDAFDAVYARYAALPRGTKAEIVDGQVRVLPRPRAPHIRAASRLGGRLESAFGFDADGPGGWVILDEPELRLGDEIRAPDLAGWRAERYVDATDGPFTVVPDWVCEVLSPSTARYDRSEKMPLFAAQEVGHFWIVDPQGETLEVYRREGALWLAVASFGGDVHVRAEPFDAVELDLGALWRLPPGA